MATKKGRIQPNRSTQAQRFACDDFLRENLIKRDDGTVDYPANVPGASDEGLADQLGMTVWAVQKVRKSRYGNLPDEDSARGSAPLVTARLEKRLSALEKRFEEMVKWSHDVDRYLRRKQIAEAQDTIEPVVDGPANAEQPDALEELLGSNAS